MKATGNDEQVSRDRERAEITGEARNAVNNSCMRIEREIPNPLKGLVEGNFNSFN